MSRPDLTSSITADEFDSYYWYKDELVRFAKLLKLSTVGGKFEIHDRISAYLRGDLKLPTNKPKPTSSFDWSNGTLSRNTIITDNYKNTKNVRNFLQNEIGEKIKFSITLMNWMKNNVGTTLGDFIDFYPEIKSQRLAQEIPDHNQFNRYVREFLKDNPNLTKEDALNSWKKVIEIPRPGSKGRGISYNKKDLQL